MAPLLYETEATTSAQDLGKETIFSRNGRVEDLCRKRRVRRFIRSAPYIIQKRLFYNSSEVCTCNVPKAASTSIGRLMLMAEYPENAEYYRMMPGNMIHTTKQTEYLNTEKCSEKPGISFFVTRDPYARLYSAYLDKVFLEKFGTLAVLIDAVLNKRKSVHYSDSFLKTARENHWMCDTVNVTFEQFLQYVAKTRHLDPHFTPVSLLCNPCKDPVDYIFKQEDLTDDADYLLDYLNKSLADKGVSDLDLQLKDYAGDKGVENIVTTHYVAWKLRMKNNLCPLTQTTKDHVYKRLWQALKMLGNIDDNLEYMPEMFTSSVGEFKDPRAVLEAFVTHNIQPLTSAQRTRQRRRYLVEAYKGVSDKVLTGIQTLFQLDFKFFRYDINPPR